MNHNHATFMVVLLWLAVVTLAGCASNALQVNAEIARGMLELQSESGPMVRRLRIEAAVNAGRVIGTAGGSEERATEAAQAEALRWQCAIDSHSIFADAVSAYIGALSLSVAEGRELTIADGLPFLANAANSYAALRNCLQQLGHGDALPEVPEFVLLIPEGWETL